MSQPTDKVAPAAADSTASLSPLKRAFLALEQAQARVLELEARAREPIAIIGLGCRTPGGVHDADSLWKLFRDGVDAVSAVPADRMDIDSLYDPDPDVPGRIATREGGFLGAVDGFDATFFGIAPREAQGMDPQQRLLLEVSWEALEHAGQPADRLEKSATGVYVGVTGADYSYLQVKTRDPSLLDAHFASGIAHSIFSGRLSYVLGLQGPSVTVDTACSSSLVGIHLACQALRNGECRMALAGGVNLILCPDLFISLSRARMLAPDGRCKTFDAAADGFARGEGCGVVVLKKLSDAQADGDRILAVIRGSAVNQDGPSSGLTAPNGPAQEAVIRDALARGGLIPRDVGYIEAHGTGTQLGDPLEVHALGAVFGADRQSVPPLWIGSAKTNLGHLEAAAGVTGLIKLVLSLRHRTIPPHLHFRTPSPYINWAEFPLRVPTQAVEWEPINGRRIGGVSSFGFSGTNAHLVVEEYSQSRPAAVEVTAADRPYLFVLSARDAKSLRELAARYATALTDRPETELAAICHTAGAGRAQLSERAAIVVHSISQLRGALEELAAGRSAAGLRTGRVIGKEPPKIAFLFTGQGSQYAGMTRGLYESEPVYRTSIDECARLLRDQLDRPLLEVLFPPAGASTPLDHTGYTQPVLFSVEYALAQLWRSWGITPNIVMGHSVGELVAACVAGVFELGDALRLVAHRGRLMQSLPSGGAMAAIDAAESRVAQALRAYTHTVSIAAINGPAQTVISGAATAVAEVCDRLTAAGVRCKSLAVSHAFHSPLVEPVLERFEHEVAAIQARAPRLRLVSNVTGRVADTAEIVKPSYWRRHIREAVRFADGLQALAELRPDVVVEVGPHPVLLAFVSAMYGDAGPQRLATVRREGADLDSALEALAGLWLAGAAVDWRAVLSGPARRIVDLPSYPFQRERYWFQAVRSAQQRSSSGRDTGHSLLGARLRAATSDIVFESIAGADAPAFVRQHRVMGRVLLPATAYLDTLLACGRQVLKTEAVVMESVTVREAMILADDGATRTVQTVSSQPRDRRVTISLNSLAETAAESDGWIVHATANVRIAESTVAREHVDLQTLRNACTDEISLQEFYSAWEGRGVAFGPAFRSLCQLWRGDRQALARVALAADLIPQAGSFILHPVLLDGALQVGAAALASQDTDTLFLPIGIGSYEVLGRPSTTCWAHVVVHPHGHETRRLDLNVFDDQGVAIARLKDIQVKRVTREALERIGEKWLDDSLYEIRWRRADSVAPAASQATGPCGTWVLFADEAGIVEQLAQQLRIRGDRCVLIRHGEDDERALREALAGKSVTGIVHGWALDHLANSSESQQRGALSALSVAKRLLSEARVPSLWLLTRGGQSVEAGESMANPASSTMWGLGKSLALAHPELHCVCVDLDTHTCAADLQRLIAQPVQENQLAIRNGELRVPRLSRISRTVPLSAAQDAWRLVPTLKGSLDSFQRIPLQRPVPKADEVEIAVEAAGLNFRDVLNALDMYPGDAGPLGGECAGRVVAVGSNVKHVRPGDPVVAVAGGSFSSHVMAQSILVQPRPPGVSAEEGAAFSIPYITAEYCLGHVARMKRGDRVLIHAAAGGVGMSAVRLAQRAGAEVFATAGSVAKRQLLRNMGVQHVFDSRTPGFAVQILEATGGHGVDVVLNSLSGDLLEPTFSVLARGGRFVEIGKRDIKDAAWVAAQHRDWQYTIVDWSETAISHPDLIRGIFARLVDEWRAGLLPSLPRHTFSLEESARAFRFMAQARHVGKIVIRYAASTPFSVRRDGSYLVTGGLSGLGLRTAQWLAECGAGRLILISRRGLTAESTPAVAEMRHRGAEVVVEATDVSDEPAMDRVFSRIHASGPVLRGVIHAAGVIEDATILRQTPEGFARVLAPKVQGAWNLDQLTRGEALDWFVLFSSAASVFGSAGQANYAAANAYLDMLAHERHAAGLPALSINWGAWTEVGAAVDRGLLERLAAQGLGGITPADGMLALQRLVETSLPQAVVFPVDWHKFTAHVTGGMIPPFLSEIGKAAAAPVVEGPSAAAPADDLRQRLLEAPESRRPAMLTHFVREHAARALGIGVSSGIDPRTPLGDLGLDSLLAVELRNTLGSALRKPLPATLLFDHPTVAALAGHIGDLLQSELGINPAAVAAPAAARETAADSPDVLLDRLEQFSEDELDRLLASKLQDT